MTLLETTVATVDRDHPVWIRLKDAVTAFRALQRKDGALAQDMMVLCRNEGRARGRRATTTLADSSESMPVTVAACALSLPLRARARQVRTAVAPRGIANRRERFIVRLSSATQAGDCGSWRARPRSCRACRARPPGEGSIDETIHVKGVTSVACVATRRCG